MSILGILGTGAATAIGGPAGGATAAVLPGILSNLLGGAGRDAQRLARDQWFEAQALAGSVWAARILLGGVSNTAGNESPYYSASVSKVTMQRTDVMNAAYNAGGAYWDTTDNASSDKMRALVNNELATMGLTAVGAPGATTLPLMTTTASASASRGLSTYAVLGIVLGLVVIVVLVVRGRK